jgi:ABC-type multidrug transport system fused ATPase/permease subunit
MKDAGLEKLLDRKPEIKHKDDSDLDIEDDDFGNGEGIYFKLDPESLSAGEKQLICIARAVLRKNKIVVLDEATANIDIKTEESIQKLMNEHFKNSTVFTIAHRINTIINSNMVVVMDKGKCIEYGNPQKLSKDSKSEFYQLIQEIEKKKEEEKK